MTTGEDLGYQDAIRQVQRSLQRRMKSLEEDLKDANATEHREIQIRLSELHHMLEVVASLHR